LSLGLYVHWPFCRSRCPYCDFNAHVWRRIDQAAWREALLSELRHARRAFDPAPVSSLFFGGGTPSLMPPSTVGAVLATAAELWGFTEDVEITLEANPGSAEAARFQAYAAAGVNRISVGVQSLRDAALAGLGRRHSAAEARAAVAMAQDAAGRVSLDLITARPGQGRGEWEDELGEALALGTEHLSVYQLTFEPGTPFERLRARGAMHPLGETESADIYRITGRMTAAAGLAAYEVSNHAREGAACRHNLLYWRGGDWIGIGPGAHGRPRVGGRRVASEAVSDPATWLQSVSVHGHGLCGAPEPVPSAVEAEEYLMMALRLSEGGLVARYRSLGGSPPCRGRVDGVAAGGWLVGRDGGWVASPKGRLVLDGVLRELAVEEQVGEAQSPPTGDKGCPAA